MVTPSATGGGLTAGTTYYINAVDSDTVSFHTSLANALAGTPKVDLTGSITAEIRPLGVSNTTLYLNRYVGDAVDVNGETVLLGSSGISLTTTDNLITSTGADAGSAMGASTLYYIYVSNSSASPFASDLRASTTAPSLYNGVKYLGTSGNAANWRFVGWIRTNGSTNFIDSPAQRFVVNYYNRVRKALFTCPGYLNNGSTTSWTYSGTSWQQMNGGTGNLLEFIANGEDGVDVRLQMCACESSTAGSEICGGIGEDSTSVPITMGMFNPNTSTYQFMLHAGRTVTPSEGYHYFSGLVYCNYGPTTITVRADYGNAAGDIYITYLCGTVMA
jgi:hypothetical protein